MHVTAALHDEPAAGPADAVILVVSPDANRQAMLAATLMTVAQRVESTNTGRRALAEASRLEPDVVVMELELPDLDGVDVCRALRDWFSNPIIVLCADASEGRKIEALDAGADDCVVSPPMPRELCARVRVALRHRKVLATLEHRDQILEIGDLRIDVAARMVLVDGDRVRLVGKTFDFLALLAAMPGRVFTYREIGERIWGEPAGPAQGRMRVLASSIRSRLGVGPRRPRVEGVRGIGYRLTVE